MGLIVVVIKISECNNVILFFLFNLVSRFIILIRVLVERYAILIFANIIKLGLFPFTHLIIIFYKNLNLTIFIILNICKLPYLFLISLKLNIVVIVPTMAYSIYIILSRRSTILIIRVYRVISRVIILNF